MKKEPWKIFLPSICLIIYLVVDYFNIPSILRLQVAHINLDILNIVISAVVVITLYIISFYYIDNRQIEKDKNAIAVVKVLFDRTYAECLENLIFLDNRDVIEMYILPKVNGDKADSENKVILNLQTLPFSTQDKVMSLAGEGYISESGLKQYLDIKKEYQHLVSMKITFFDRADYKTQEQRELSMSIDNRDKELKRMLENNTY